MVRHFGHIILVLYLAGLSGFTVHLHFCNEKLVSIAMLNHNFSCCCKGKESEKADCCRNITYQFKLEDKHQVPVKLQVKEFELAYNLPYSSNPISFVFPVGLFFHPVLPVLFPPGKAPLWLIYSNITYYG